MVYRKMLGIYNYIIGILVQLEFGIGTDYTIKNM